MINANNYVIFEKFNAEDIKRINDAIDLLKEITSQIAKCTSTYEAYEKFQDVTRELEEIRDGEWKY